CTNPEIRPSWRSLTDKQKHTFLDTVNKLKQRPLSTNQVDMATWSYDNFVHVHWDNVAIAHGVPAFLAWHRYFISGFEKALKSIEPSVSLPFWDWTLDSQNPAQADIFLPQYLGGNGKLPNMCVTDGIAANWTINYPTAPTRPGPACLKRCFSFTGLYSPEAVAATLVGSADYNNLRNNIESGGHGAVHLQVGGNNNCGDMGTMYSTNDPLFFLHHAMVDRIWWRWQQTCPSFATLYSEPTAVLQPWGVQAVSMLSTINNGLCYNYGSSPSDLPLNLACPNGPTTPLINNT
ncbi:hypothetical protein EDD86DRAFT_181878, partial [Gorgonomyces haynaldii]